MCAGSARSEFSASGRGAALGLSRGTAVALKAGTTRKPEPLETIMNRLARLARLAAPATVAALALPFSACSVGKVLGEVDGDLVPAFRTGILFEANESTDADDTVAVAAF